MVSFYKKIEIFLRYKWLYKKKRGIIRKLINVKLKGWKDKTVNEPIINGKMNKIK